jgi:ABC-type Zn uptake system ZnuABC Zn-binding protein ZnuA
MVSQIAKHFQSNTLPVSVYTQNASQYQKKLAELDWKYQGVEGCQNRKIFHGHSAFGI